MILQSVAAYDQYVVSLAQTIPNEIGVALAGGGAGGTVTSGAAFDLVWNQAAKAGLMVWAHIPSYSLKGAILTLCVAAYFVVAFAAILAGFIVYLVSAVLLSLLLTVGPLFIALYPFPPVARFFNGWLSATVSAVLTQILAVAVLALLIAGEMATVNRIVQNAGNGAEANFVSELLVLLEAGGLMAFVARLIKEIPSITVAIAGGVYQNANRLASTPMSMVAAGAAAGGSMAGRGIGAAASGVAGAMRDNSDPVVRNLRAAARRATRSAGASLSNSSSP
jgi:type IV secretory pathway VirB6-like protein